VANLVFKGTWSLQAFRNQDAESFDAATRPYAALVPPSLFLSANYQATNTIPEGSFVPGEQFIVNWDSPELEEYCFKVINVDMYFQSLPTQGVPTAHAVPRLVAYYPIGGGDLQLRRGLHLEMQEAVINGGYLAYIAHEAENYTGAHNFIDGDMTPNLSFQINVAQSSDLPRTVKLSFGCTMLGWPINVRRVGAMWLPELFR